MSKHTPGPWKLKNRNVGTYSIEADGGIGVAFTLNTVIAPEEEDESPANARLIAAAPEMLDCIRWMAQTVHQAHHTDQPGTFRECPKNTCKHAAEILAKAKGGEENDRQRADRKVMLEEEEQDEPKESND